MTTPIIAAQQSAWQAAVSAKLELKFNIDKSKCMIFCCSGNKVFNDISFNIAEISLQKVDSFKYLGFIINSNMSNSYDIDRARNRFYQEYNAMLRKFNFSSVRVQLFLFSQYCLQLHGVDLLFLTNILD